MAETPTAGEGPVEDGFLSATDFANSLLEGAEEPEQKQEEEQVDARDGQADEEVQEDVEAQEPEDCEETEQELEASEDDSETQDEAEDEPGEPAIDPPVSWAADAKEKFSQLPRDLQETIAKRESERERTISEAKQDAAKARKEADAAKQEIEQRASQLDQTITHLQTQLQGKWAEALSDAQYWPKLAAENPDDYVRLKAAYDQDVVNWNRALAEQQKAEKERQDTFLQEQEAALLEAHPEYSDPAVRRADAELIVGHVKAKGIPDERIKAFTAAEWDIALEAAKAANATKVVKKQAKKKPPKPASKPSKRVNQSDRRTAAQRKKAERLAQTGSPQAFAEWLLEG